MQFSCLNTHGGMSHDLVAVLAVWGSQSCPTYWLCEGLNHVLRTGCVRVSTMSYVLAVWGSQPCPTYWLCEGLNHVLRTGCVRVSTMSLTYLQEAADSSKPDVIMESSTDIAEWKLEVERVLPQLKITARTDNKVVYTSLSAIKSALLSGPYAG